MSRRARPRQLELDLPQKYGWGGRRPGAGRKAGPNPLVRHRSRPGLAGPRPCHVTLKVREDVPSLRSAKLVREIERSFARWLFRVSGGFPSEREDAGGG
jgi:hypothetical protein